VKKTSLLFALICLTTFVFAQKSTLGVRLGYYSGKYAFPSGSYLEISQWENPANGLEPGIYYRAALGHSPIYVAVEASYYTRKIKGYPITLEGTQSLLQLPLLAGAQIGKGNLRGFAAIGLGVGIFTQKKWEKIPTYGQNKGVHVSPEYSILAEGGLRYDITEHLQLGLGYRYSFAQHSITIKTFAGPDAANWETKRNMLNLEIGWKFE